MQSFDIVINGGGMVGLALACGLQGSGLRVAVIERQAPEAAFTINQPVIRFSTINTASRWLLQHVQVWDAIIAERANPYYGMEVWERDGFGCVTFNSSDFGYSDLGYVIENRIIRQKLWQRADELTDISLITPGSLRQVEWDENEVFITLDDDRVLTAKLVVAADGANSWLRTHADIPLTFYDYQHHALVATVKTAQPHGNIARQIFHGDGILAFLPLSDPNFSSIVWSLPPELAYERLTLPSEVFNIALATNFSLALGLCELYGKRHIFPLTSRYARNFAAHRLVLVGDAAHTVHPLVGQGVNLGFMDVAMLLGEVWRLQKAGKDFGHYSYLRRYERSRKQSAALMLAGVQSFCGVFSGQHPLKKWIRSVGLRLVDICPSIKLHLIQQAMGLNDLPSWLVPISFN